jgi:hypothetical protein
MKLYSKYKKNYVTHWTMLFGLVNRQLVTVEDQIIGHRWRILFIPVSTRFKYEGEE